MRMFDRLISMIRRRSTSNETDAASIAALERVSDPTFKGWTFFDTCCLSDLVKLATADKDKADRVRAFVKGLDVVVPQTILQEIGRAPALAQRVADVLSDANLYLIPHPTNFWECDIWNFLNTTGLRKNVLAVVPMPRAMFHVLDFDTPLRTSFHRADRLAETQFFTQIARDRGENVGEHKLVAMIWGKANDLMLQRYKMGLAAADCRPENFPSLFTYYYAYYFRYLVQRHVVPTRNDFVDLAHASAAPYSRVFYGEQKLVQQLKQIQRRPNSAPTPYSVAKKMYKEKLIDSVSHEEARRSDDMRRPASPILQSTRFVTHMEMHQAVLAL